MAELRVHLFDRHLGTGQARTFCGQRDAPACTEDPGEVTCQTCMKVLDADTLSEEGAALRSARDRARSAAMRELITLHRSEFAGLWDKHLRRLAEHRNPAA